MGIGLREKYLKEYLPNAVNAEKQWNKMEELMKQGIRASFSENRLHINKSLKSAFVSCSNKEKENFISSKESLHTFLFSILPPASFDVRPAFKTSVYRKEFDRIVEGCDSSGKLPLNRLLSNILSLHFCEDLDVEATDGKLVVSYSLSQTDEVHSFVVTLPDNATFELKGFEEEEPDWHLIESYANNVEWCRKLIMDFAFRLRELVNNHYSRAGEAVEEARSLRQFWKENTIFDYFRFDEPSLWTL